MTDVSACYEFGVEALSPDYVASLAKFLMERGMVPVAIKKGEKRPIEKAWQRKSLKEAEESWPNTERLFLEGAQLGVTGDDLLFLDFEDYATFMRFMNEALDDKPVWWDKANHTWFELTGARCRKCGYESKNTVAYQVVNGARRWACGKCGSEIDPEKKEYRGVRLIFRTEGGFPRAKAYGRFGFGLEVKGKGSQTLISPSIHPTGVRYQCVANWGEPAVLTGQELAALLEFLGITTEERITRSDIHVGAKRTLNEKEVLSIVDAVKQAYVPGHRNDIDLALGGWLLQAGVDFGSAKEVFRVLTADEGDEERKKTMQRLEYTYQKSPGQVVGMRGKNAPGLVDILRDVLGEERAAASVKKIQEVLGWASPWNDAVFEVLSPGKGIYAVAWPGRKEIVRGQWIRKEGEPDRFVVTDVVVSACPKSVRVYPSAINDVTLFEVEFTGAYGDFRAGPTTASGIIDLLKKKGVVKHPRLVEEVVPAVFIGYMNKGKAEIIREPERPGFFLDANDGIVPVKVDCEPPTIDELRDGLAALDRLIDLSAHFKEKAVEIVKRVLVSPFAFVYKTKGRFIPAVWLYGFTGAGKTTFTQSAFWIWGEPQKTSDAPAPRVTGGSSANTEPRLGEWLSRSGMPVLINEAHKILENPHLLEMIKDAVESTVARSKFVDYSSWTDYPSLSLPFFTANGVPPLDPAILRKLTVMQFTRAESAISLSQRQKEAFERWMKEEMPRLPVVGKMAGFLVTVGKVKLTWDYRQDAENLLKALFAEVGAQPPDWVSLTYQQEEDTPEARVQELREYVREKISGILISEYFRVYGRDPNISNTIEDFKLRVTETIRSRIVPWLIPVGCDGNGGRSANAGAGGCTVVITAGFIRAIREDRSDQAAQDIASLKNLADILGDKWAYKLFWSSSSEGGQAIRGVGAPIEDFVRFLAGEGVAQQNGYLGG